MLLGEGDEQVELLPVVRRINNVTAVVGNDRIGAGPGLGIGLDMDAVQHFREDG